MIADDSATIRRYLISVLSLSYLYEDTTHNAVRSFNR